jgi:Mce-associated membrane protein
MTVNETEVSKAVESDVDEASYATGENEAKSTKESADDAADRDRSDRGSKSVSISVRGLIIAVAIAALMVALGVMSWLYVDARSELSAQATQSENDARASKIALDYAVNAATMNFNEMPAWREKLVAGTSPELNKRLSEAGTSMEQVLVPLQWSSTAQPLVAKVRSVNGGIYIVDSFVSVQTKTVQAPEALQSTATYSTTIDSNNNWQITDVGGIGSAMEPK